MKLKEPKMIDIDAIIIGAGPAGLSAGIYAARGNLKTIILEGKKPSALSLAEDVKNYPGFDHISGKILLDKMKKHALTSGAKIIKGDVIAAALDIDPKMITTRDNTIYMAKAVIVATGKDLNKDKIDKEEKYIGRGVSYCALCDGPLYRERPVVLYGQDEEAIEDALALHEMNAKVTFICPKSIDELQSEIKDKDLVDLLKKNEISIIDNTEVIQIIGDSQSGVSGIKYRTEQDNGKENEEENIQYMDVDAIFIISHVLSNKLLENAGLELQEGGWVEVGDTLQTNIPGVFAAGDITGKWLQVVEAVSQGGKAAIEANRWIRKQKS